MVIIILPLVAALFFVAGCLEKSSDISKAIPEAQTKSAALCPPGLHVDFDSDVCSSLFSIKGSLTPLGNGSFPYLLLNATLRKDGMALKSTKYLMIDVKSGEDHGFEIAKNMLIWRGNYSCTLEISGPTGILSCETRGCRVTEPWTEPSSTLVETSGEVRSSRVAEERSSSTQDESDLSRVGSDEEEKATKRESGAERILGRAEEEAPWAKDQVSESPRSGSQESGSPVSRSYLARSQVPYGRNVSPEHAGSSSKKVAGTEAEKKYDGTNADANVDEGRAGVNSGTKDAGEKFAGSSSSKKYHRLDCRYAQKIKPENRIYFSSEEDARSQGYLPCKVCIP